jgi:hypothetical protein
MAKTAAKGGRAGKKGKKGPGRGGGGGGARADAAAGGGAGGGAPHARKLAVRATTPKGRRALAAREPKETEDLKGTVMLYGRKASQVVKVRETLGRGTKSASACGRAGRAFSDQPSHLPLILLFFSAATFTNPRNRTSWPTWPASSRARSPA